MRSVGWSGYGDPVDSLEQLPRRAVRAEESAYVDYEVHQLVVGSHLLLEASHRLALSRRCCHPTPTR